MAIIGYLKGFSLGIRLFSIYLVVKHWLVFYLCNVAEKVDLLFAAYSNVGYICVNIGQEVFIGN